MASPSAEPTAEGEIVLEDYAIDLPEGFDGTGTFAVRNAGPADHELILMRYKQGKGLADLVAWSEGGIEGHAAGHLHERRRDHPAGRDELGRPRPRSRPYIALCVITGPTGQPHALMGMTEEFEIG